MQTIHTPSLSLRQRLAAWLRRRLRHARWLGRVLVLLMIVLAVVYWKRVFISIDPGHAGVLWRRFFNGTEQCKSYSEGLHVIAPWDRMYIYDIRTRQLPFSTTLYSQDGLELTVSGSLRYHLNVPLLSYLQTGIGPDYETTLLIPLVISALRKVVGAFSPHEIYSEDEKGMLQKLRSTLDTEMQGVFHISHVEPACQPYVDSGYIFVEEFYLLQVGLPTRVESAIQYKLEQEQYAQAYEYILQRETDERTRRKIEAEGIRDFEEISKIPILKWRGIEATEKLAGSNNSKMIIMGSGANQLPVILNSDGSALAGNQPEQKPAAEASKPAIPGSGAPGVGPAPPPAHALTPQGRPR